VLEEPYPFTAASCAPGSRPQDEAGLLLWSDLYGATTLTSTTIVTVTGRVLLDVQPPQLGAIVVK
jgi:hypothetical protein